MIESRESFELENDWEEVSKNQIFQIIAGFYSKTGFSQTAEILKSEPYQDKPNNLEKVLKNKLLKSFIFNVLDVFMSSFEKLLETLSQITKTEEKIKKTVLKITFSFYSFVFLNTLELLIYFIIKNIKTIFLELDFISYKKLIEIASEDNQSDIEKLSTALSLLDLDKFEKDLIFSLLEVYQFLEKFFDLIQKKPEYFTGIRSKDKRTLFKFLVDQGLKIPESFPKLINSLKEEIKNLVKDLYVLGKIINEALSYHREFDNNRQQPSFHNENHIKAVLEALEKLIIAAKNGNDPLRIKEDLERWNKENNIDPPITLEEFWFIALIAFACHDLGNIATLENGKLKFLYQYTSKDAEERSKLIAKYLLNQMGLEEEIQKIWLPLIEYLIDQTKFQPDDPSKPFAIFVRVVDQIGGNLFNEDRIKSILGLIYEIANEEGRNKKFNPHYFYNFPHLRFPELVPDERTRKAILNIWKKETTLEENLLFPNQETTYGEYIQKFKETNT